jgi:hypothetical protein
MIEQKQGSFLANNNDISHLNFLSEGNRNDYDLK